jgi:predicted phosphodiesterase
VRLAVISDIHSNLQALESALELISERSVDAIYCLGDIVGYGADPAACVDLVRSQCVAAVRGNHDEAVALERGVSFLPKEGQKAIKHNRSALSEDQLEYLASLPYLIEENGCCFVHASPFRPDDWLRLESLHVALEQFEHFDAEVCFVGHTHVPAIISDRLGVLHVRKGHRYLINVGSVGQPRDMNPHLALGFFDSDAFSYELVRLPYDIEGAIDRIKEEGLPRRLGKRLRLGL